MKYLIVLVLIVFGCSSTPQAVTPPSEKKKPTKDEMCNDPNTPPEVLRLFCQ